MRVFFCNIITENEQFGAFVLFVFRVIASACHQFNIVADKIESDPVETLLLSYPKCIVEKQKWTMP